ncbi:MAG TPA: FmdB family zinc ribbon protein [Anaeromyxobacteraceae bacterium]|nr:FmdB family zinc ribbon protein [Anaeromyxobacteraceae bacterium]
MPEYEFYCKTCGKPFTSVMHIKEHDLEVAECPECHNKKNVEKLISSGVSVFTSRKSAESR